MIKTLSPQEAKGRLHESRELAFLDVREAGQFGEGHPLFAIPCPYSRIEPAATRLVPNLAVPVLVIDAGDGVAERAARALDGLGYRDVLIVEGGTPGWEKAGFTLFKGVNVPSKTLGELAEHEWHPKTVDAPTLKAWQASGSVALFDGRPPAEYGKMHVPGAVCMPNGELAFRLDAVPRGEDQRIVVGCAGRTRGLVGAIGLKLMGHAGDIYALENGTQGWALAGLELERGVPAADMPELTDGDLDAARKRAEDFAGRWSIPTVSADEIRGMLDDTSRTTFVFDVRSAAEAARDPLPCARHALSGQMVQSTDQYVGVRHARIVLCDDAGIRAGLTAFWIRQLGYEPVIALIDDDLRVLSPPAGRPSAPATAVPTAAPDKALADLGGGNAVLVDLRNSMTYRRGHVAGAVWGTRARLADVVPGDGRDVLLVADEEELLAGAARDLGELGASFAAVEGGQDALVAAGAEVVETPDTPSDEEAIDFLHFVHDRHDGNLEASRRYIAWEMGLIDQLDEAEAAEFRLTPNPERAGA